MTGDVLFCLSSIFLLFIHKFSLATMFTLNKFSMGALDGNIQLYIIKVFCIMSSFDKFDKMSPLQGQSWLVHPMNFPRWLWLLTEVNFNKGLFCACWRCCSCLEIWWNVQTHFSGILSCVWWIYDICLFLQCRPRRFLQVCA